MRCAAVILIGAAVGFLVAATVLVVVLVAPIGVIARALGVC